MITPPRKPFWKRKRWIIAAVVAGVPLAATSITASALLSLRHVPASVAGTWSIFLAFLVLAAVNAAIAAAVPAVAAARLSNGRAWARVAIAVTCGAAGLLVYVLACFAARSLVAP